MRRLSAIVLMLVLCSALIFLGFKSYESAKTYESISEELNKPIEPEEQIQSSIKSLFTQALGIEIKDEKREYNKKLQEQQVASKNSAQTYLLIYSLLIIASMALVLFLDRSFVAIYLSVLSGISLGFALFAPLMIVSVWADTAMLGKVVLSWHSYSLLGSIEKLYDDGELIVASVIALFSVIIPIVKIALLLAISLFVQNGAARKIVYLFELLGKWSMVDVFVLAILLTYLTADGSATSSAELLVGFYLFLIYVLLSMVANLSVKKCLSVK